MGIPYICPYNVNSIMNPILVMCMGLGYLFNLYRGKPLVREGGVVIMFHPTQPDFHPVHHPSYIDFYEQVLTETTDPHVMSKQYEERYANDDWYRHLYRTGNAYHGVHPFYMWYWGAHAMQHCGRIIIVGGDPKAGAPARLRAGVDARRRPRDRVRRRRPLADDHPPAQPADPDGRRSVSDESERANIDSLAQATDSSGARVTPVRRRRCGRARTPRRAARAGQVERAVGRVAAPGRNIGFPFRAPTIPRGVEVPDEPSNARRRLRHRLGPLPAARVARGVIAEGPMRAIVRGLAAPEVFGTDRLDDLRRQAADSDEPPPPLIFAPNHHSHLDTALMVRAVPFTWRKRLVVAAAADYFFDKRWKATLASLSLNVVPIDRESTGRKSADMIRELVDDGWSLVIYPEGGRSPDGWGQDFKAGAAYLSARTGAPVVPVFIDGTGSIFGKGMKRPEAGTHAGSCSARRCRRSRARTHAASTPASRPP